MKNKLEIEYTRMYKLIWDLFIDSYEIAEMQKESDRYLRKKPASIVPVPA